MGSRYLTDLADVCRRSGFNVIEVEGWQQRARGSGGYDGGRPNHVMCHHTASGASMDGWGDVNYMTFNHQDAPLCNLYLSRTGDIYVCAGGATNTNGSGHDPCGTTADDSMNSSAIGIEAGNNGVGEQWPDQQQDAFNALCKVLCDGYGIPVHRVHAHFEWAPSRKIDPAGNSRYATGGSSWNMDLFRADVSSAGGSTPEPEPVEEPVSGSSSLWFGAGRLDVFMTGHNGHVYHKWYIPDEKGWDHFEDLGGVLRGQPSATGSGDGNGSVDRIDITGMGVDDPAGLWHLWYVRGEGWSGWERLGDWPG